MSEVTDGGREEDAARQCPGWTTKKVTVGVGRDPVTANVPFLGQHSTAEQLGITALGLGKLAG